MTDKIYNYDTRIATLKREMETLQSEREKELRTLKAEKNEVISKTEAGRLAVLLHKKFCNHNHTDACGWEYEFIGKTHDWSGYAHNDYLNRAEKLLKMNVDPATAIKIMELV